MPVSEERCDSALDFDMAGTLIQCERPPTRHELHIFRDPTNMNKVIAEWVDDDPRAQRLGRVDGSQDT